MLSLLAVTPTEYMQFYNDTLVLGSLLGGGGSVIKG